MVTDESSKSSDATGIRRIRRNNAVKSAQVRVQRRGLVDGAQKPAPRRAQRVQRASQVALRGARARSVRVRGAFHLGDARLRLRGGGGDARQRLLGARGGKRGDAVSEALEHGVWGK